MQLSAFLDSHLPALETQEARHNLILAILLGAARAQDRDLRTWSLGGPGRCAVKSPGRAIVLGELPRARCRDLAERTRELAFPGVVGPDRTAQWFVERAQELGLEFLDPMPQRILALCGRPIHPGAAGQARRVTAEDAALLADWTTAFLQQAVPHDPLPPREEMERKAGEGQQLFWVVDGEPVSMAAITRRTRHTAAISFVYTPPDLRGRGYAGSVTAAVVESARAEGRETACLYTDLRNPASNRCYEKIGFEPVCDSWFYPRRDAPSP